MTLMLHAGAEPIDYDGLRLLSTPVATETHVPIPHHRVVDLAAYSLSYFGHEVVERHFGVTQDGMRFFGVMTLRSPYGDYADTIGLRNSHDKSFPIGIAFGSRVFICDNMAFSGDYTIKRKHTAKAKHDLPGLVGEIIEPLAIRREEQARKIALYKDTKIDQAKADHAIMSMYRQGIISVTKIADVHEQFVRPVHDWGGETVWRLFNAVTFALTGRVIESTDITPRLHRIADAVCLDS
ncbi:hypothetical protein X731_03815 [Mesorhizobium sp. L2C054A000]|nr:DUF932 domain-containing protein [Mesorhizobium sp. L2C054A000]ESZ51050.1 hypothetical protein X731_03815 [Mesorhizobium sp. L2C054A000]